MKYRGEGEGEGGVLVIPNRFLMEDDLFSLEKVLFFFLEKNKKII